jgi:hypothetical protein
MLLTYPSGVARLIPYLSSTPVLQSSTDRLSIRLIGTILVTAVANLMYVGPKTTEIMQIRKHQETRDGKSSYEKGPHSKEMQALNRQFSILHSVSSITNLVGLGAMIWYGAILGAGLSFQHVAL